MSGKKRLTERFPPWLKKRLPTGATGGKVRELLTGLKLNTVCRSARCPNIAECFARGTATFMIMGEVCTRGCRFCAVAGGTPEELDVTEPGRVGEAARALGLTHVVVTSVTRDDLGDGGAGHFVETIGALRGSGATVEVLAPDFGGREESVRTVVEAGPEVFNHNVETVERLYEEVRPEADYRRSLEVLRLAKEISGEVMTKSGLMVGLGEEMEEVAGVMEDLRGAGVEMLTVGQYLRPSREHVEVKRFVEPGEFEELERLAKEMGFRAARCGPFVRSSYRAEEVFKSALCENGLTAEWNT